MMLFGGERDNQALNEMWRFHFATEFWEKLSFPTTSKPMPRTQTTAFILSQFKTRGAVHYMGLNEQDYFGSQPDPEKKSITTIPTTNNGSQNIKEESFYEEIDDSQIKNYTFAEPNNCLVDEEDTPELKPKKIYEKLQTGLSVGRTRNNFHKLQDEHPNHQQQQSSLKVKMSNLSKMSAYSTYSMFSNESNESLNIGMTSEDKSSCHTMTVEEDLTSPSSSSVKLNFSLKKSQSMISSSSSSKDSSVGSVIARDKSLQSFTQALIHAEPEESSKLKEENIYEAVDVKPAKKSDSSYTFQSYDCSSRSSTLSSNPCSGSVAKPLMGTRVLPPRNNRIVDLELTSAYCSGDEMSSLSGYESIDGSDKNIESMTSFSNPNYLCPDAKTMVERKQQKNKYDETLARDESHQNFAAALNSPAESLISDYHDFQSRLHHDLVDLNPAPHQSCFQKPSVKITSFGAAGSGSVHLRPRTTPVLPRRKPRPVSSGPLELSSKAIQEQLPPASALSDDESSLKKSPNINGKQPNKNQLSLLMFVLGGRLGQVTVFNGPISLWKLDLTKTF